MTVRPLPLRDVEAWTDEADVVVVGFGAGGAAAAWEAATAGAETVLLERAGAAGGAAALSDGQLYLGGGTPTQQACGFDDTVEDMKRFLIAAVGPNPDLAKIELYCDRSQEHYDWLLARGITFRSAFWPEGGPSPQSDEGLMYTGGENAWPFDEIAAPVPRGHIVQGPGGTGRVLMAVLAEAALASGARAHYDTRAERLVTDDNGRVCGVVAAQFGGTLTVRARTGVVLTAGGFIYNDEMLAQYAPALLKTPVKVGTPGDDGAGIRMAQAVGARVKRMDAGECAFPFSKPRGLIYGILVDANGQRFINEDTYMGRVGQRAFYEHDGQTWLILDEQHYEPNWLGVGAASVCETPAQLESECGFPPGALVATLAYYNEHAANGEDPVFHKRSSWLAPLTGPLAALDLRRDKFPYAPFTLGGLETRTGGEVLDHDGTPIPGLYAAGRTTSGICEEGYCSGLSTGDATFFGRLAGQSAAGVK